jgi:hypothetical protein
MLEMVKAFVGDANQLVALIGILRVGGDAMVHAHADGQVQWPENFGKHNADAAAERRSLRRLGLRQDQRKFVATGAKSGVRCAERLSKSGRRCMKNFVAARVAVLVVHFLKAVQIQRDQTERVRIPARTI